MLALAEGAIITKGTTMSKEISNQIDKPQIDEKASTCGISTIDMMKEGLTNGCFSNKLEQTNSTNQEVKSMLTAFNIDASRPDVHQQPLNTDSTKGPVLEAKLPWEHPKNPTDAANKAYETIKNGSAFNFDRVSAEEWLNDGDGTFKTKAANEWNRLYQDKVWSSLSNPDGFHLRAIKSRGQVQLKAE